MKIRPLCLMFVWIASTFASELTPEEVAANSSFWPGEVTLSRALQVPLIINGQAAGTLNLPAGRTLAVKGVSVDSVTINTGSSSLPVPIADTDLLARATAKQQLLAEKSVASPTPAGAPTPPPAPVVATATPTPAPTIQNSLAAKIASDLVAVDGRKVKPFSDARLTGKKYLAVYYSASWCGPCRKFTPELVQWYRSQKSRSDLFEVVFVSRDRSPDDMVQYMIGDRMPWPALDYGKSEKSNPLSKFSGPGIPCLVILDENGQKVLDSYEGSTYIGPRKVLEDFEKLLKKNARDS